MELRIELDDLSGPEVAAFLGEHINEMKAISPPESKHALDLDGLRKPEVTFWTVWDNKNLVGCGALKELNTNHGEIKSMRTSVETRGKGVASRILEHIITEASHRGYSRLSLETGAMSFFKPAHQLYRKYGFIECLPFAEYIEDPNSIFMCLDIMYSPSQSL